MMRSYLTCVSRALSLLSCVLLCQFSVFPSPEIQNELKTSQYLGTKSEDSSGKSNAPENRETEESGLFAEGHRWHGFLLHEVSVDSSKVFVVAPVKAAAGRPWVWRVCPPAYHCQMDSVLVARGFHIIYVDLGELINSTDVMSSADLIYKKVTSKYGLNKQVAFEGVDLSSLFIFSFAGLWPERVCCIYAESPVLNFNASSSAMMLALDDTKEGMNRPLPGIFNPEFGVHLIANVQTLAQKKIPLFFTVGLQDSIVPYKENALVLAQSYIDSGGPVTISPNTSGLSGMKGHEFPVDNITSGVDFIQNCYLSVSSILDSGDYHNCRSAMHNSQIIFEREKKGRVVFLGGSITYNPGWRDSICAYLQQRFPDTHFDFINAGIPSTGSTPGAFRFERDVLAHGKVDLLFEEAAVNDRVNGFTSQEQILGMEGIVRHARLSNPAIDIVLLHFVDPDKIDDYHRGVVPQEIVNYEKVASHYDISTINLAKEVTDRIDNNEFSWDKDFVNLHPSPFGQHIYSRSIKSFLDCSWSGYVAEDDKIESYPLPDKLDQACFDKGELVVAATVKTAKAWSVDSAWKPKDGSGTREDFANVPMLISETPNCKQKFEFQGNAIGIAVASGPDAGMVEYRIDRGAWKKKDLYTKWSASLNLPWFINLATGLTKGKHVLELRISSDRNEQSSGNACLIRYFLVNRD